jgi:uncharacterized protein with PIN domain
MQYWDSSALVTIVLDEKRSDEMRRHLDGDPIIVTSILTPIEIASAVSRRAHHRDLTPEQHVRAMATFADLSESWIEVSDFGLIRTVALDLLTRHLLRAGDAVHGVGNHIRTLSVRSALPHSG